MPVKFRDKLLHFINSDKDVPLLTGFSVGFYMMLFYYSKNYGLANSWQQIFFFLGYYILFPTVTIYIIYKLLPIIRLEKYKKHFLFVACIGFFSFFLSQLIAGESSVLIVVSVVTITALVLSVWISKYYKLLIILFFFLSVFNGKPLAGGVWKWINSSDEWKMQPDNIEDVVFKKRPNIYYIQPDGYTAFKNLKNKLHNFDNSNFETFLAGSGFTLYPDYRSNYYSTLLSNAATFSMKHHYLAADIENYSARGIIVGSNPVLRILKNNKYRTHFITESPYLIINRPVMDYDYCNINYSELPYIGDGLAIDKNVEEDLKKQILKNKVQSGNFYFVEKFLPGHIATYMADSKGADAEKTAYFTRLEQANVWLKKIIKLINTHDKNALIIIGADHGGFVGFNCMQESLAKTDNKLLIHSVYGAALAVKSNDENFKHYEGNLVSGVNLFRTIFSYLADNKAYLKNNQQNESYMYLQNEKKIYKYINNNGSYNLDTTGQ